MKNSRLLEMIYLMLEEKKITMPQMAEYFDVSNSTIYEDVKKLKKLGVPLITEPGKNGGITIKHNEKLNEIIYTLKNPTKKIEKRPSILEQLQKNKEILQNQAKDKSIEKKGRNNIER